MARNVEAVLQRGDHLDELQDRSRNLEQAVGQAVWRACVRTFVGPWL
jgi:hypothetical protein